MIKSHKFIWTWQIAMSLSRGLLRKRWPESGLWHPYGCHELGGCPNTCLYKIHKPSLTQHEATVVVLHTERNLTVWVYSPGPPLFLHWRVTINANVSTVLLSQDLFTTNMTTECLSSSNYLITFTTEQLPAASNLSPSSTQRPSAAVPPNLGLGIIVPDYARFQQPIWSSSSKTSTEGKN